MLQKIVFTSQVSIKTVLGTLNSGHSEVDEVIVITLNSYSPCIQTSSTAKKKLDEIVNILNQMSSINSKTVKTVYFDVMLCIRKKAKFVTI